MLFQQATQQQIDVNTIISAFAAVSVAINGFFLRSVARKIESIDHHQRRHADRLTWLEAHRGHSPTPRRRAYDPNSGDYLLPPEDIEE